MSPKTSSDELISFMHRAILCRYKVLFVLAQIEKLSSEKHRVISDSEDIAISYDFEGEDTTYIIGNKDWDHINLFDTIIDGQKVSTIIDESKNMATMRGEECGILVHYMFKKSNGTWILHKIVDSTN